MKKILKSILCCLIVATMPLYFSACKKNIVDVENVSNQQQNDNNDNNNPPAYVVDGDEVKRLVGVAATDFTDFVTALNDSNVLENNSYNSNIGNITYGIFNYIFYPNVFAGKKAGNLVLDHLYIYDNSAIENYFKISTNGSNDGFSVDYITCDNQLFRYIKYDFMVDKGALKSIDMSYYETGTNSSYTTFSKSYFDFENEEFEIYGANIISSFNGGLFSSISSEDWGYSFYEKINFSEESSFESPEDSDDCLQKIENNFSNFMFVNYSNKISEMRNSKNMQGTNYSSLFTNYFAEVDYYVSNNMYAYDTNTFTFEK